MPTGYTATLVEQGQTFTEFTLGCARAFGACIEQRDDPMDDMPKVPKRSTYHDTELDKAKAELAKAESMTSKERLAWGTKSKRQQLKDYRASLAKKKEIKARLETMIAQVEGWVPPSADHNGLKKFMLEQLASTMDHDGDVAYYEKEIERTKETEPLEYFEGFLKHLKWSVEYHKKEAEKDNERTDGRTQWITDLYDSLTPYDNGLITYKLLKEMK